MPTFYDTHAHLDYPDYNADLAQVIERAAGAGITKIIAIGTDLESSARVLKLGEPFAGKVRGVFHCFVNDAQDMRRVLAMGSLTSFTGIVTFKNAQDVRDTVAATPLDRLILETDCPYLAPTPYRGQRCEPTHVKEI